MQHLQQVARLKFCIRCHYFRRPVLTTRLVHRPVLSWQENVELLALCMKRLLSLLFYDDFSKFETLQQTL